MKRKIEVNDLVMLPRTWTYGRRIFRVNKVYKNNDLQLVFMGGKEKGETISRYGQDEVIHIGYYQERLKGGL